MYDARLAQRIASIIIVLVSLFFVSVGYSYPLAPNPDQTQGELCSEDDSDFVGYRYAEKIAYCKRNVTWSQKKKIYDDYGIPENCRHRYTIDHFIPLSLGGSNADLNLWPEHVLVKQERAQLEQDLFKALSRAQIKQSEAIEIIIIEKMQMRRGLKGSCDDPQS